MRRSARLARSGFVVATLLAGLAAPGASRCSAAPIASKPLKLAVLNLESLNRDRRGPEKLSRRFFADLLVQALKTDATFAVAHLDLAGRDALDNSAVRRSDLALSGDYIELLDGTYHITLRLYDVPSHIAVGAWSEDAPTWRGAFFDGREQADQPAHESPALKKLAGEVREAMHQVQVWWTLHDLHNPASALKAQVKADKELYRVFDPVVLTVKPAADAYVTVLSLSSTGGARVLFPRPKEESSLIKKNETLQVPPQGWTLRVTDQVGSGEDCYKILLTREPLRLDPALLEATDAAGATKLLEAIAARLGEMDASAWGEATCLVKVTGKQN